MVNIFSLALFAVMIIALAGEANSAGPSVESCRPIAGEIGTEFEVTVVGSGLRDVREVLFDRPGVECVGFAPAGDEALKLMLRSDKDAKAGMVGFRVRSDRGLSECHLLKLNHYPVVPAGQAAASGEGQTVLPNRSILGELTGEETHRYRIALRRQDPLAVEVEAIRLGVGLLDAVVTIRDPQGVVVASSDDTGLFRQDPAIRFRSATDGDYVIEVTVSGAEQGEASPYLLHLGFFPRPLTRFPLGGISGATVTVVYDRNSEFEFEESVTLPASSGQIEIAPQMGGAVAPTAMPFRVSDFPSIIESGANDDWGSAGTSPEKKTIPVAIDGRIESPGDRDHYWIEAEPFEPVTVEVYGDRMGTSLDARVWIVDEELRVIASADDDNSLDPRVVVTPPGRKVGLIVEDKGGRGGEAFGYRIEMTRYRPGLEVFLPRRDRMSQARQAIVIPSGNRVLAFLSVSTDVVGGEPVISFPDLPAGVTATVGGVPSGGRVVPVVFEASQGVSPAGGLIDVRGSVRGSNGEAGGGFRQRIDMVAGPADTIYRDWSVDRLAIATCEVVPYSIRVRPPEAELVIDGTIDVVVEIDRSEGFDGGLKLSVPWLPPWVDSEAEVTVPPGETLSTIRLRAWGRATPAEWPLVIEAEPRIGGASVAADGSAPSATDALLIPQETVASRPVSLRLVASPVSGVILPQAGEQGSEAEVVCKNAFGGEFSGRWVATLEGLPNRVKAEPIAFEGRPERFAFAVKLEPDAPLGVFEDLVCRVTGRVGDDAVSYVVASGGKLSIAPAGKIVRDATGRPLSRLEILRRRQSGDTHSPQ